MRNDGDAPAREAPAPPRFFSRARRDLWHRPAGNFAALDGMRGFASIIVVVYHCALFSGFFHQNQEPVGWFRHVVKAGFWTGIDIFFVLSGFLIGRILMTELSRDRFIHYRKFLIRRSFRIFPAYYLVLGAMLLAFAPLLLHTGIFSVLFGAPPSWEVLWSRSWANAIYVSNYLYPGTEPNVLQHGWSLCVEEHFYLILPPLLWAVFHCRTSRARAAWLAGCTLLPLFGRALQYARDPSIKLLDGFYFYSHNRFDEIFIGVFIAYVYVAHRDALQRLSERLGHAVWGLGFACVASVWTWGGLYRDGAFAVVWQFFVMALGSGLILVNGLFLGNRVQRFFAHRLWYPLARISYGTYLLHLAVLFSVLHLYTLQGWNGSASAAAFLVFSAAVFGLASLLAAAMFMLLERPLLDVGIALGRRMDTTRLDTAALSLSRAPGAGPAKSEAVSSIGEAAPEPAPAASALEPRE